MGLFIHYLDSAAFHRLGADEGKPLHQVEFDNKAEGVALGSYLYVVCVLNESVHLVSRMILDNYVAPRRPACVNWLPLVLPADFIRAFCLGGTPIRCKRTMSAEAIRSIRFYDSVATLSQVPELISEATPCEIRRITLDSAGLLDGIVDDDDD